MIIKQLKENENLNLNTIKSFKLRLIFFVSFFDYSIKIIKIQSFQRKPDFAIFRYSQFSMLLNKLFYRFPNGV